MMKPTNSTQYGDLDTAIKTPRLLQARDRCDELVHVLTDPARCEQLMPLLLVGYIAIWLLYALIAQSSQDVHPDMAEIVAWSRETVFGTPLAAWLVRAWFSVFPRQDWAYYLLAILLPTVSLWISWRIAGRYLPDDKRVVGIALLTLVPFYNFQALKVDANTVLTPIWAATTWWFLRSFETRTIGWAVLAGIGAAACMLGGYWSIVLLVGLGLAALTNPHREAYFNSSAPYITLAVVTVLLTPHADWLITNHNTTFAYAFEINFSTFLTAAKSALLFIAGSFGYVSMPILLILIATRPNAREFADTIWPLRQHHRLVFVAFAAPFLVAMIIVMLLQVKIGPSRSISAMTLLPVAMLSSPLVKILRSFVVLSVAIAIAFPVLAILASPIVAIANYRSGFDHHEDQYRLIAQAVERAWQQHTKQKPLRIVGSFSGVANGAAFYMKSEPSAFDVFAQTPWVDDERIRREGLALVCPERICKSTLDGYASFYHATAIEHVMLPRRYLGMQQAPVGYEIVIIPPGPNPE